MDLKAALRLNCVKHFYRIFLLFVGLRTLQAHYEKLTTGNLVQHGFPSTIDVYQTHDSNEILLPMGCNDAQNFRFGP